MERRERWLRYNPLCVDCKAQGRVTAGQEVDHVIPLFKGGADDPSNYQTLCKEHHAAKTARDMGHSERAKFDAQGRVIW